MDLKLDFRGASILLVDDEIPILDALMKVLRMEGYHCDCHSKGSSALERVKDKRYDLVLTDIRMPDVGGIELMELIRKHDEVIPIVAFSAVMEVDIVVAALRAGVVDYLVKPFGGEKLKGSVKRALEIGFRNREKEQHIKEMERRIQDRERTGEYMFISNALTLVDAMESNTKYHKNHSRKVVEYCNRMCGALGLSEEEAGTVSLAAILHDLGNLSLDMQLFEKQGKLDPEDWKTIREHVDASTGIVAELKKNPEVLRIVRSHHEKYDGTGYPDSLKGDDIPLGSRILAVADAYVAMVSDRPYRASMSHGEAVAELLKNAGGQFDDRIVGAFLKSRDPDVLEK